MNRLLSVEEAQSRLLALAEPLEIERVPLVAASGRWSAEPLHALRTQPFAALSAMDGYAIRFDELPGPWKVTGEISAGMALPAAIRPGVAARIFTGAPLPPGADTVLVQEDARQDGDRLMLAGEGPGKAGRHVRVAGSDFAKGNELIRQGESITPARLGLAAAGGHALLPVRRPARVALLSTGDELVLPEAARENHHLPSSNAPMLAALLASGAATIQDLGIVRDDLDALVAAIGQAGDADVIITTGGASVGDHDLVRPAFAAAGARLDFWKVAMRPGKPLMAGKLGRSVVLGLPGNPVSAFVTACLFAKPLIAALGGAATPLPERRYATLADPLPANGPRTHFMRGFWRNGGVASLYSQDSAMLTDLAAATVLIIREPNAAPAAEGETVEFIEIA